MHNSDKRLRRSCNDEVPCREAGTDWSSELHSDEIKGNEENF